MSKLVIALMSCGLSQRMFRRIHLSLPARLSVTRFGS